MKKVSMLTFMDAISDVVGRELYAIHEVENKDFTVTGLEELEFELCANATHHVVCKLTSVGKWIADMFFTLDRINGLDLLKTRMMLCEFDYTEYSILDELNVFVKGDRAIPCAEVAGLRFKDCLIHEDLCGPYEGDTLTPEEFKNAQLRLLRFMNPKCVALSGVHAIERPMVYLTEDDYLHYPVMINGEKCIVAKSNSIKLFALNIHAYDDEDYAYCYTSKFVKSKFADIASALLARSAIRASSSDTVVSK